MSKHAIAEVWPTVDVDVPVVGVPRVGVLAGDVAFVEELAAARQQLAHEFSGGVLPSWAELPTAHRAVRVVEGCWWLRAAQRLGVLDLGTTV